MWCWCVICVTGVVSAVANVVDVSVALLDDPGASHWSGAGYAGLLFQRFHLLLCHLLKIVRFDPVLYVLGVLLVSESRLFSLVVSVGKRSQVWVPHMGVLFLEPRKHILKQVLVEDLGVPVDVRLLRVVCFGVPRYAGDIVDKVLRLCVMWDALLQRVERYGLLDHLVVVRVQLSVGAFLENGVYFQPVFFLERVHVLVELAEQALQLTVDNDSHGFGWRGACGVLGLWYGFYITVNWPTC